MNPPGAPPQNGNAATITALRAIPPGAYTSIALAGYYAAAVQPMQTVRGNVISVKPLPQNADGTPKKGPQVF